MISCIFCSDFALCIRKMYNHSTAAKNFPGFPHKMFRSAVIRGRFTNFDKGFAKIRLWKNLWKV